MKKEIPKQSLRKPLTWWDRLLWRFCSKCRMLFKKENGSKEGPFSHQGGGLSVEID